MGGAEVSVLFWGVYEEVSKDEDEGKKGHKCQQRNQFLANVNNWNPS